MFLLSGKLSGLPLVKFQVFSCYSWVSRFLQEFIECCFFSWIFYTVHRVVPSEVSNKTFSTNTEPMVQRSGAIKYQLTLVSAEITLSDRAQHLPEINTCVYTETQFFGFGQDFENWVSNTSKKISPARIIAKYRIQQEIYEAGWTLVSFPLMVLLTLQKSHTSGIIFKNTSVITSAVSLVHDR